MARTSTRTGTTSKSPMHSIFQRLLRVLQFLSAAVSLILFSLRIAKVIRLYGRATRSNGAVEGILAAATLYTLIAMLLQFIIRGTGSNAMRMLLILFDILFVAAFIVVAVLTSPKRHGSSAPCNVTRSSRVDVEVPSAINCNLPWGTFVLAIVSTILHAFTVAFHAAKDHRKERKNERRMEKEARHNHNSFDSSPDAQHGHHVSRV